MNNDDLLNLLVHLYITNINYMIENDVELSENELELFLICQLYISNN